MAITFHDYNGNEGTGANSAEYPFTFPSIKQEEVKVEVDNDVKDVNTHYTVINYSTSSGGKVRFTTNHIPTLSTQKIRIFRETDVDNALATYQAGSSVRADDLNDNEKQLLHAAQEEQNQTIQTHEIKDLAVTRAKIAPDAIDDTKIADDSIKNEHIANDAVETEQIKDGQVDAIKLNQESGHEAVVTNAIRNSAVTKEKIGAARLFTLADMQSGTASKLIDGTLTASIADLNELQGMDKETSLTNSDLRFPTSKAVISYVTAQIDALDAFKILANEVSFPNTQFDSGVVISIADAGGIVINGSGTSTTARTLNGTTVTINNFPTSLNNETLASGVGLLVSSTGSGQIYNYHKLLATENDVKQLSDDINDFNSRYRTGATAPTTNNDAGDLFFNTTSKVFQVYNGTDWEEVKNTGNFFITTFSESFDGSRQDFTIANAPTYAAQILLSINGVIQKPNTGTSTPSEGFALSGSTVKLAAAPAAGSTYYAVVMGEAVNIGSPSDNTVATASLQSSAVSTVKIADDAVTPAKLSIMDNTNVAGTAGKLRLNPEDASTTWQRENKHLHQIRDDVYVESTLNVGDKAGFDFTPLAISAFSYSGTTLTLTTATHAIAVGDNILIKDSASGFQEAFNTISGTTGTTVKVTRSSDPSASLSTANTKVIAYTPADPRGCINVAKDHDKFDQNTFNPILRGYVGKDLATATGTNTEAFKIEIKKDSSATDHVATLLHSTREFGSGQRLALTIDDGDSYPDGKNLVLTQNGVKITADDSAFTDSDELLEVEGNAKIDGNIIVTGTVDSRDVAADGTKLDGIESNATADQTVTEIKSLIAGSPLDASHIATDAVGSAEIAANAVTSAHIAANTITADDIATDAVGSAELAANAVSTAHVADDAITTAKITDGNITSAKLAASAVTTVNLDSGAVTDAKVNANAAIAFSKLATGTLPSGIKVNHNNLQTGIIEDENISSSAAIAGSKISPTFTSNITVSSDHPKLLLTDSNADSDFSVHVNGGVWHVRDETNNTNRIEVQSDGTVDIAGNLDANGGVDVTGNITVSGTVDGRDVAADGTKLDGIDASADVTDATTVNAAGAVMNSDLDGKGELLVGDGSGDPSALAVGTDGYILKADSSTATGLAWSAAGSGGDVNQNAFSNVAVSGQTTVAADSTTDTLNLAAGSNVTITTNASNDTVTIAATDTNTTYSVGDGGLTQNNFTNALKSKLDGIAANATNVTNNNQLTNGAGYVTSSGNTIIGTDSDINTSGATVIDQLNMTDGVIQSHSTRTMTLADLGYTGATNANNITNNNQLSNGAGYITSADGGNADQVDGLHASSFIRSDTGDTASGDITFSGGAGAATINGGSDIRFGNGNWTGESTKIQHHGNSLYIQGGTASSEIILRSNSGSDRWRMQGDGDLIPNNNTSGLGDSNNGLSHIFMAGSIYLGGNSSSNELDDYEEGTWSPALRGGSSYAGAHSMQAGSYTKVGRQVTVSFGVAITSKGNMSGDLHLVGLPFGVASILSGTSIEASGICGYWSNVDPNSSHITCVADDSDGIFFRHTVGTEDNPDQMQHSDIDSDFTVRGTVVYFTS